MQRTSCESLTPEIHSTFLEEVVLATAATEVCCHLVKMPCKEGM